MPPVKKPKNKPVKKVEAEEPAPVVSGQLAKKIKKQQKRNAKLNRGVLFIKHLPHGFFEDQLQNYFEQFGTVTRLRLARSKLTGGTKGYAFVEFEFPEVAEVAAETMDNYLMFNKVVKAAYIPPEKQMFNFFKTSVRKVQNKAGKPIYVSSKTAAINRRVKKFNDWNEDAYQKRTISKLKKIDKLNKKYPDLGIDFNNILVGSKKVDEKLSNDTEVSAEDSSSKGGKENIKTGKRKNSTTEQQPKKSKKVSESKDEDDEESENDVDNKKKGTKSSKSSTSLDKSVHLEDLLGDTINDESDDEEWEEHEYNTDDDEESEDSNGSEENADNASDSESSEYDYEETIQEAKKITQKAKGAKVDRFEQIIQHKKNVGGVQKAKKAPPQKAKIGKAKNSMQMAMVKQLAKPMQTFKKVSKGGKK